MMFRCTGSGISTYIPIIISKLLVCQGYGDSFIGNFHLLRFYLDRALYLGNFERMQKGLIHVKFIFKCIIIIII